MNPAIYALLIQLVEAGATVVPELIAAAKLECTLIGSKAEATPEQLQQISAALDAAHAALQAS